MPDAALISLLEQAKLVNRQYRELTGRPLGCTGEIGELEVIRILGLEPSPVRQAGYDVVWRTPAGKRRVQIKSRCVLTDSKPSQRIGSIDCTKEWDTVMLVLLDENLDATEIYAADRDQVVSALEAPGSKARNERSALSISKFRSIGKLVWNR